MSGLTENIYDIKDLCIVKLKENYLDYLPNDKIKEEEIKDTEYFNPNLYYIVEKCIIRNREYCEFYTECIVGRDFYRRIDEQPITDIPLIFEEIYPFNKEWLSKEERMDGRVTTSRLFQIFQQLNFYMNIKDKESSEVSKKTKLVKGGYGKNY